MNPPDWYHYGMELYHYFAKGNFNSSKRYGFWQRIKEEFFENPKDTITRHCTKVLVKADVSAEEILEADLEN